MFPELCRQMKVHSRERATWHGHFRNQTFFSWQCSFGLSSGLRLNLPLCCFLCNENRGKCFFTDDSKVIDVAYVLKNCCFSVKTKANIQRYIFYFEIVTLRMKGKRGGIWEWKRESQL